MAGQTSGRVFGITGYKNNGKTVLTCKLVEHFVSQGRSVSTIKHAHHDADIDQPGRDSYRHRAAGATEVLLSTSGRWMHVRELRGEDEPALEAHLERLSPVDLVLVEGFKRDRHPKIEVHRAEAGTALIAAGDPTIVAIATDEALPDHGRPIFALDDVAAIARFIEAHLGLA